MAKISDIQVTNPYPDAEFVEIENILNEPIEILGAVPFENKKGPGIHILANVKGKECRLCSHGVAICDLLSRKEVQEILEGGETIECKFVKIASEKNPSNKVLKLVDA